MKRLALVLALATLVLPAAAPGAACSPLNCAPSQFSLGNGTLLGFRAQVDKPVTVVDLRTGDRLWQLPAGLTGGHLLVHQDGLTLVWYDAARGTRVADAQASVGDQLVGVSQDGSRAVTMQTVGGRTTFAIVTPSSRRAVDVAGTTWGFDALRGDHLFLIRYLKRGYQVRLLHVRTGALAKQPLKDPHESATIWGSPFSRLASADGRYLFTLYVAGNGGAMVHMLDLQAATARCIDLPGTGDYGAAVGWGLALSRNGRTLWAASPGYGRVVGIDLQTRRVRTHFRFTARPWTFGNATSAVVSPAGRLLALSDANGNVTVLDLAARRVAQRLAQPALALGYAPDGTLRMLG